jgi:hypothetical protein
VSGGLLELTSNINGNQITFIYDDYQDMWTNEAKEPENYVLAKDYVYAI